MQCWGLNKATSINREGFRGLGGYSFEFGVASKSKGGKFVYSFRGKRRGRRKGREEIKYRGKTIAWTHFRGGSFHPSACGWVREGELGGRELRKGVQLLKQITSEGFEN